MQPRISIDSSEFRRTLAQYMRHTQRDLAAVLNGWGYDIAKDASRLTYKTTVAAIEGDVGIVAYEVGKRKTRTGKRAKHQAVYAGGQVPMAALLINASRGRRGEPGYYGQDMRGAIDKLRNSRKRAIGGLKAGWLPAVVEFGRQVGVRRFLQSTLKYNERMGGATPARASFTPRAELWNSHVALVTRNESGVARHLFNGLWAAISKKISEARQRMEAKLQNTANRYTRR